MNDRPERPQPRKPNPVKVKPDDGGWLGLGLLIVAFVVLVAMFIESLS